jgi:hypothetical protein
MPADEIRGSRVQVCGVQHLVAFSVSGHEWSFAQLKLALSKEATRLPLTTRKEDFSK